MHFLVPSWRRTHNIPYLIQQAELSCVVKKMTVWYDNPPELPNAHDGLVELYKDHPFVEFYHRPGIQIGGRYQPFLESDIDRCLTVADDVLITAAQLRIMNARFDDGEEYFGVRGKSLNIHGDWEDCKDGIAHSPTYVHANLRSHVIRYNSVAELLGYVPDEMQAGEDYLFGFSQATAGIFCNIVDFFEPRKCYTSRQTGIALSKGKLGRNGYTTIRLRIRDRFFEEFGGDWLVPAFKEPWRRKLKYFFVHQPTLDVIPIPKGIGETDEFTQRTNPIRLIYPVPHPADPIEVYTKLPWTTDVPEFLLDCVKAYGESK